MLSFTGKETTFAVKKFKFNKFEELHKHLASSCTFDAIKLISGFDEIVFDENSMLLRYKLLYTKDIDAFINEKVQTTSLKQLAVGYVALIGTHAILFGDKEAAKNAMHDVSNGAKVVIEDYTIPLTQLRHLSNNMAFLKSLQFTQLPAPSKIKKATYSGTKIESFAELPMDSNMIEHMTCVSGVLSTPYGIRNIKANANGTFTVSKKKHEEFSLDFFHWLLNTQLPSCM